MAAELELRAGPVTGAGIVEAAASSDWAGANEVVGRHAGHARLVLRATGSDVDTAGRRAEPLERMLALSRIAATLLELPGALALLDEEARVLTAADEALQRLAARRGAPPLELWVGLRSFELADARGWFLDTLGMAQLGLPDLEAYAGDGGAASQVSSWLRNLGLYLVQEEAGARLRHGDTLDGPDEQPWGTTEDTSTAPPRRPVLRFAPLRRPA